MAAVQLGESDRKPAFVCEPVLDACDRRYCHSSLSPALGGAHRHPMQREYNTAVGYCNRESDIPRDYFSGSFFHPDNRPASASDARCMRLLRIGT